MPYIDLHTHTTASDGSDSPSELIEKAHAKDLSVIAITDHDTVSGIASAKEAIQNYPDMTMVSGIEMSCTYNSSDIHILGYFVEENSINFLDGLKFFLEKRTERNNTILARLSSDGINITTDDLTQGHPDTVITRAHIARALIKLGYVKDISTAFEKYLQYGGRYCPNHKNINIEEVMQLFKENKIWPSLAHPMQYHMSDSDIDKLVCKMIPLGLRGIEVYHSSHKPTDSRKLLKLCKLYHLLPTGGSDYHGLSKPKVLLGYGYGGMCIPESIFTDILNDNDILNKRS